MKSATNETISIPSPYPNQTNISQPRRPTAVPFSPFNYQLPSASPSSSNHVFLFSLFLTFVPFLPSLSRSNLLILTNFFNPPSHQRRCNPPILDHPLLRHSSYAHKPCAGSRGSTPLARLCIQKHPIIFSPHNPSSLHPMPHSKKPRTRDSNMALIPFKP